ncbi:MAG TPA: aldehyde dehydrogenase family protein, partial [Bacilli bacterium]|nr:aldehyde dehydrogenase family protein [Bacilli bacterium]
MKQLIEKQKDLFTLQQPFSVKMRITHLQNLKAAIKAQEDAIYKALDADLRKSKSEAFMTEVGLVYEEINHAIKHLKKWAAPKKVKISLAQFPAKARIYSDAYGQVLIMSPWNYPFQLTLVPLVGAIAAGNVVIVKPSAYAPNIAGVMKEIIETAFPHQEVILFLGGRSVNEEILTYKFDYIFFTGSVNVGKTVMSKASLDLTPVTLELGGKSPCVVFGNVDLKLAARRIAWAKLVNMGQTCVAPDYLIVDRQNERIIDMIELEFNLAKEEMLKLPKIINEKHYLRLKAYLTELGLERFDDENQSIYPSIVKMPSLDAKVMQEEIFGPILPVLIVDNLTMVKTLINASPKPLAMYVYSDDKYVVDFLLHHTSSGSFCVNDSLMQLASSYLPFGGVGESGIGSYHGHQS